MLNKRLLNQVQFTFKFIAKKYPSNILNIDGQSLRMCTSDEISTWHCSKLTNCHIPSPFEGIFCSARFIFMEPLWVQNLVVFFLFFFRKCHWHPALLCREERKYPPGFFRIITVLSQIHSVNISTGFSVRCPAHSKTLQRTMNTFF